MWLFFSHCCLITNQVVNKYNLIATFEYIASVLSILIYEILSDILLSFLQRKTKIKIFKLKTHLI